GGARLGSEFQPDLVTSEGHVFDRPPNAILVLHVLQVRQYVQRYLREAQRPNRPCPRQAVEGNRPAEDVLHREGSRVVPGRASGLSGRARSTEGQGRSDHLVGRVEEAACRPQGLSTKSRSQRISPTWMPRRRAES